MKPSENRKVIKLTKTGFEVKNVPRTSSQKTGRGFYFLLGKYGELGFVLIFPLVGGILIGGWVDKTWLTHPRATLAGIIIGTVVTFGILVSIVLDFFPKKKT